MNTEIIALNAAYNRASRRLFNTYKTWLSPQKEPESQRNFSNLKNVVRVLTEKGVKPEDYELFMLTQLLYNPHVRLWFLTSEVTFRVYHNYKAQAQELLTRVPEESLISWLGTSYTYLADDARIQQVREPGVFTDSTSYCRWIYKHVADILSLGGHSLHPVLLIAHRSLDLEVISRLKQYPDPKIQDFRRRARALLQDAEIKKRLKRKLVPCLRLIRTRRSLKVKLLDKEWIFVLP